MLYIKLGKWELAWRISLKSGVCSNSFLEARKAKTTYKLALEASQTQITDCFDTGSTRSAPTYTIDLSDANDDDITEVSSPKKMPVNKQLVMASDSSLTEGIPVQMFTHSIKGLLEDD